MNSLIDKYLISWIDGIPKNTSFDPIEVVMLILVSLAILKQRMKLLTRLRFHFFLFGTFAEEKREIFYEVCYPKRNVKQIPNDYDTYKILTTKLGL